MAQIIEQHWLDGLTFRSSERTETTDGPRDIPTERELLPEDVLSFAEFDDHLVIVAADGRKHVVDKAVIRCEAGEVTLSQANSPGIHPRDIPQAISSPAGEQQ